MILNYFESDLKKQGSPFHLHHAEIRREAVWNVSQFLPVSYLVSRATVLSAPTLRSPERKISEISFFSR